MKEVQSNRDVLIVLYDRIVGHIIIDHRFLHERIKGGFISEVRKWFLAVFTPSQPSIGLVYSQCQAVAMCFYKKSEYCI
jgi:hypothetical protein